MEVNGRAFFITPNSVYLFIYQSFANFVWP